MSKLPTILLRNSPSNCFNSRRKTTNKASSPLYRKIWRFRSKIMSPFHEKSVAIVLPKVNDTVSVKDNLTLYTSFNGNGLEEGLDHGPSTINENVQIGYTNVLVPLNTRATHIKLSDLNLYPILIKNKESKLRNRRQFLYDMIARSAKLKSRTTPQSPSHHYPANGCRKIMINVSQPASLLRPPRKILGRERTKLRISKVNEHQTKEKINILRKKYENNSGKAKWFDASFVNSAVVKKLVAENNANLEKLKSFTVSNSSDKDDERGPRVIITISNSGQ